MSNVTLDSGLLKGDSFSKLLQRLWIVYGTVDGQQLFSAKELIMPLYEYDCSKCEQTVEILLRRPDEQATCPTCGNAKIERLLSVPAAPSVSGGSLPVAGGSPMSEESCGAPRCCGGGCQM